MTKTRLITSYIFVAVVVLATTLFLGISLGAGAKLSWELFGGPALVVIGAVFIISDNLSIQKEGAIE